MSMLVHHLLGNTPISLISSHLDHLIVCLIPFRGINLLVIILTLFFIDLLHGAVFLNPLVVAVLLIFHVCALIVFCEWCGNSNSLSRAVAISNYNLDFRLNGSFPNLYLIENIDRQLAWPSLILPPTFTGFYTAIDCEEQGLNMHKLSVCQKNELLNYCIIQFRPPATQTHLIPI